MSLYFGNRYVGVGEIGLGSAIEDERGLYKASLLSSGVGAVAGAVGGALAADMFGRGKIGVGVGAIAGTALGFVVGVAWGAKYSDEALALRDGREARAEAGEPPVQ